MICLEASVNNHTQNLHIILAYARTHTQLHVLPAHTYAWFDISFYSFCSFFLVSTCNWTHTKSLVNVHTFSWFSAKWLAWCGIVFVLGLHPNLPSKIDSEISSSKSLGCSFFSSSRSEKRVKRRTVSWRCWRQLLIFF